MKPTLDAVIALLHDYIARERPEVRCQLTADTNLLQTGLIDSFLLVQLTDELATQFGLSSGDFVPEDFATPRVLLARLDQLS